MNKDPAKFKNIRKEITIMQNLNHEGVIKLYESVESITKISLVVEYGGEMSLLDYLRKNYPLSPEKLKDFSRQLLKTIIYLHDKNIVHRDIKPQNILVKFNKNTNQEALKLIDYGFSTLSKFMLI
jgi:aurora kinase